MSKVLNFDQFLAEKNHETLTVKVLGKEYQVPMEIPAIVPVMLARAEESMDNTQGTILLTRALDMMLGKEHVDEICKKGISSQNLYLLAQKLFAAITKGEYEDGDAQELTDEDSRVPAAGKGGSGKK